MAEALLDLPTLSVDPAIVTFVIRHRRPARIRPIIGYIEIERSVPTGPLNDAPTVVVKKA